MLSEVWKPTTSEESTLLICAEKVNLSAQLYKIAVSKACKEKMEWRTSEDKWPERCPV